MFIAGRHAPNTQSPRGATCDSVKRKGNLTQGRNARRQENGKVESVGVGLPNPSGEVTSPLR